MIALKHIAVEVACKKVGSIIGKRGETIKALQRYTGTSIVVHQQKTPVCICVAGPEQNVQLAEAIVNDIARGTFRGFAILRQIALGGSPLEAAYVQGYGFVPMMSAPEDHKEDVAPPPPPPQVSPQVSSDDVVFPTPLELLDAMLCYNQNRNLFDELPPRLFEAPVEAPPVALVEPPQVPFELVISARGTPAFLTGY